MATRLARRARLPRDAELELGRLPRRENLSRLGRSRPKSVLERLFPPEHVQYFTLAGIHALVQRSALRPLHIATRPLAFGAVAGGLGVKADNLVGQLPDRGSDRQILICALLESR